MGDRERGQATVEWVGLIALIAALALGALLVLGLRVPGTGLGRAIAAKILCAAAAAEGCGDEPALIAAYGTDVAAIVRDQMPSIAFEKGARALPVDFRRCRSSACADGSPRGLVHRTDRGLPVTAFVHVIDCRRPRSEPTAAAAAAPDCSGARKGNLYVQYWLYYADSATLRGVPVVAAAGYHRDDWESVQIRVDAAGGVAERASSHRGYNNGGGPANLGSDAGLAALTALAEAVGARPAGGWGPEGDLLRVSGGSHAGNASGYLELDRVVPAARIRLVPLEPLAAGDHRFAVSPPWRKQVWTDPEAVGTG